VGKQGNETFSKVEPILAPILKPFLTMPVTVRMYTVEASVCGHLVDTLRQIA